MAHLLRERSVPVLKSISEARRLLDRLSDSLHESCAGSVEETLQQQVARLTETVSVPARSVEVGDWSLPSAVPIMALSLREGMRAWLDARVGAALEAAAAEGHGVVARTLEAVSDLERVVSFNIELAANELEVFSGGPPTEETRALVAEMLQGAIGRSHERTRTAGEDLGALKHTLPETISNAVPSIVGELSADLIQGDLSALRRIAGDDTRFTRDLRRGFLRSAEALQLPTLDPRESLRLWTRSLLGQDRWDDLIGDWQDAPTSEVRPLTRIPVHPDLPLVYRRLFSDQVVSRVPLSDEKAERVRAACRVLSEMRIGRAVVVVGDDPALCALLVDELVREQDLPPMSVQPGTLGQLTSGGTGPVVVRDLGEWLQLVPDGLKPAQHLAEVILNSPRPWILVSGPETWQRLARHTPLGEVVGAVVDPGPLDVDELERALLGRHAMSGMDVEFQVDALAGLRIHRLIRAGPGQVRADRRRWFCHLHRHSGGRFSDALRLWMAAVESVDEDAGRLVLGPIPPGLPPRLDHLPDADLLVLRRTLITGLERPADVAHVTLESRVAVRGRFLRLAGRGLLHETDSGFEIPTHLRGPVRDQIRARGWEVGA
jgi:hypothetical protein